MAADQQHVNMVPPPADFPVEWERPEDAALFFRRDGAHFPNGVTPLDFAYFSDMFAGGMRAVCEHYEAPVVGYRICRFNTFFYQALLPYSDSKEETDARTATSEQKVRADFPRIAARWRDDFLPEVQQALEWWDAFDLEGGDLAAHFDESWQRARRLWQIHYLAIIPAYIAISEFEELRRQLFGGDGALDAYRALQGIPNKGTEIAQALWEVSRRAPDPSPDDVRDVLERYGRRVDEWALSAPSWEEDPAFVLRRVRELAALPDDEEPARVLERAGAERDRHVAELRERLSNHPAAVREEFEGLLHAAQEATVLQADHNFWIDFSSTYRMRRVCLALGRRLAERGAIADRDDVFMLVPDEIRAADPGDLRPRVEERRAEMERFHDAAPPPGFGTIPAIVPFESPIFRLMLKVFGLPPAPSDQPDTVQGVPGSGGTARGTARVVRSLDDLDRVQPGDVVVAPRTAPPWTPVFATAAAVVTDSGGVLSHAAVVAREYEIPAVVATGLATATIPDGRAVEVDGAAGTVKLLD
jgi:pyruvate,water dikinase